MMRQIDCVEGFVPAVCPAMSSQFSPLTEFVANQYNDFQYLFELLGKERKYLNYGYSKGPDESYEQRQEQLCRAVFDAADIQPKHTLVDVGFGSGEQDFLLAANYKFHALHGFNIAQNQVNYASARAKKEGVRKLHFHHGQAEQLGLPDSSADRVLAVECAFYFDRPRFYAEAARVLKKNGLLVLADISFHDSLKFVTRLGADLARVGNISENRRTWENHFETVRLESIRRQTLPGAQQTVWTILRWIFKHFRPAQFKAWKTLWNMAVSTQITALGFRTGLIRYDLIVLRKRA
jgi:ubiquinone/menaquinone biosynthesis C-methylase UbiE